MELPLVRLINKFLFYFCSTSLSEKYFLSLSMFFFLFFFNGESFSRLQRETCEGRTGSYLSTSYNVELPASYQQERELTVQVKRKHIQKISTFQFIKAVFANPNCMFYYQIFVSRGLRDGRLEGSKRHARWPFCLHLSYSLNLFFPSSWSDHIPRVGQVDLQDLGFLGRTLSCSNPVNADQLRGPWASLTAFTEVSLNPLNNSFSIVYWVPVEYHESRCQ